MSRDCLWDGWLLGTRRSAIGQFFPCPEKQSQKFLRKSTRPSFFRVFKVTKCRNARKKNCAFLASQVRTVHLDPLRPTEVLHQLKRPTISGKFLFTVIKLVEIFTYIAVWFIQWFTDEHPAICSLKVNQNDYA